MIEEVLRWYSTWFSTGKPRLSPSVFIVLKTDSLTDEYLSQKMQKEETSL